MFTFWNSDSERQRPVPCLTQWHKPEEIDFDDEDSDEDELFEDAPAELPRVVVSRQVPSVFDTFKHYKK